MTSISRTTRVEPLSVSDEENESSGEDVYLVESILDEVSDDGTTYFLVKWQGYPTEDSTWEPQENIIDSDLIAEWRNKKKHASISSQLQKRAFTDDSGMVSKDAKKRQTEKHEKSLRIEKAERFEKLDKSERSDKVDKFGKMDKTGKSGQNGKLDNTERKEKAEQPEKPKNKSESKKNKELSQLEYSSSQNTDVSSTPSFKVRAKDEITSRQPLSKPISSSLSSAKLLVSTSVDKDPASWMSEVIKQSSIGMIYFKEGSSNDKFIRQLKDWIVKSFSFRCLILCPTSLAHDWNWGSTVRVEPPSAVSSIIFKEHTKWKLVILVDPALQLTSRPTFTEILGIKSDFLLIITKVSIEGVDNHGTAITRIASYVPKLPILKFSSGKTKTNPKNQIKVGPSSALRPSFSNHDTSGVPVLINSTPLDAKSIEKSPDKNENSSDFLGEGENFSQNSSVSTSIIAMDSNTLSSSWSQCLSNYTDSDKLITDFTFSPSPTTNEKYPKELEKISSDQNYQNGHIFSSELDEIFATDDFLVKECSEELDTMNELALQPKPTLNQPLSNVEDALEKPTKEVIENISDVKEIPGLKDLEETNNCKVPTSSIEAPVSLSATMPNSSSHEINEAPLTNSYLMPTSNKDSCVQSDEPSLVPEIPNNHVSPLSSLIKQTSPEKKTDSLSITSSNEPCSKVATISDTDFTSDDRGSSVTSEIKSLHSDDALQSSTSLTSSEPTSLLTLMPADPYSLSLQSARPLNPESICDSLQILAFSPSILADYIFRARQISEPAKKALLMLIQPPEGAWKLSQNLILANEFPSILFQFVSQAQKKQNQGWLFIALQARLETYRAVFVPKDKLSELGLVPVGTPSTSTISQTRTPYPTFMTTSQQQSSPSSIMQSSASTTISYSMSPGLIQPITGIISSKAASMPTDSSSFSSIQPIPNQPPSSHGLVQSSIQLPQMSQTQSPFNQQQILPNIIFQSSPPLSMQSKSIAKVSSQKSTPNVSNKKPQSTSNTISTPLVVASNAATTQLATGTAFPPLTASTSSVKHSLIHKCHWIGCTFVTANWCNLKEHLTSHIPKLPTSTNSEMMVDHNFANPSVKEEESLLSLQARCLSTYQQWSLQLLAENDRLKRSIDILKAQVASLLSRPSNKR